ncbi:hypothetical protein [Mucilaginibacter myungsuensis]|uniref:Lipoprotein n=1 Tax=Mucilaginibacter myungsuensis TaxID=649104 RepID=A0A929PXP4_9SPHI|nr:hypothetical protein [Mucilaginibacter myungsuensis]MBE9663364.1 hypothetical protein [Mucilaginibacter myungsuensis]MDN3600101.1 hypothetical protein [Mucilaginibacter myungsuensis]
MKKVTLYQLLFMALPLTLSACRQRSNNTNQQKPDTITDSVGRPLATNDQWIFKNIADQKVYFKNNKSFTTNLYDLEYIGQLSAGTKAPFLILAGRQCKECDANISIYVWSPDDGPMKGEAEQVRYSYPGGMTDIVNGSTVFESRMFYGKCLPGNADQVIWLQKDLIEGSGYKYSKITLSVVNGQVQEEIKVIDVSTFENDLPKCKELPGVTTTEEP